MAETNIQSIKQRFGIIGYSPLLDRALSTAIRVAHTDLSVLITGESGVGKEAFSKIIHSLSSRKHSQFIAINCGAIPEGTINSELFGHEKGAFTGASGDRKGYFETVNGGTIFLDEVGEMPLDTQTFLLRILENGEFQRVGSSKTLYTDVRVIAATNVDLLERIRKGKFREDLYYRLATVPIHVPALRERPEDVYMLFRRFSIDFAERNRVKPIQLDERAQLLLESYRWPGNIRELKNVAERLSLLSESRDIGAEEVLEIIPNLLNRHLPARIEDKTNGSGGFQEREIMFKLLFDMKNDLNDLKSLVYGLINTNNLQLEDPAQLGAVSIANRKEYSLADAAAASRSHSPSSLDQLADRREDDQYQPIIVDDHLQKRYDSSEVVDENLSLSDNEMELIRKALKKHNGRRKEAAQDLGISERTLYRKIKEYEL